MAIYVRKWGNSLALRIPKPVADEVGLEENSAVQLMLEDGKLIIVPVDEPRYVLDRLLAQITPANLHDEVDTGEAQGGEVW